MKFTKEEISLCKQVAERYKRMIGHGNWYVGKNKDIRIWTYKYIANPKDLIPLWTISDCLEFLNKRRFAVENLHQPGWKNWSILIKHENVLHINDAKWTGKELEIRSSETLLEACLKAVLAVLKEA